MVEWTAVRWVASHRVGGKKQRLDPTTTAKLVPTGKSLSEDANSGHGHMAWECRRPMALLPGHRARCRCPSGAFSHPPASRGLFPHLLGRGMGQLPHGHPSETLALATEPRTYFFAIIWAHHTPWAFAPRTQHPSMPPPSLSTGAVTHSRPLSGTPSLITSATLHTHFTSPSHLRNTPPCGTHM